MEKMMCRKVEEGKLRLQVRESAKRISDSNYAVDSPSESAGRAIESSHEWSDGFQDERVWS